MFKRLKKAIWDWRVDRAYRKTQKMLSKYLPLKGKELAIIGKKTAGEVFIVPLPGLTLKELTEIFERMRVKILEKAAEKN